MKEKVHFISTRSTRDFWAESEEEVEEQAGVGWQSC